jgi:hypothetical protein
MSDNTDKKLRASNKDTVPADADMFAAKLPHHRLMPCSRQSKQAPKETPKPAAAPHNPFVQRAATPTRPPLRHRSNSSGALPTGRTPSPILPYSHHTEPPKAPSGTTSPKKVCRYPITVVFHRTQAALNEANLSMHKKALSDIDHHQVFGNGTHPPAHGQCLPFAMPSLMCYPGRMHRSNSENSVSTIDISHDVVPLFKQGRFPSNPSVFEEEIKVKRAPYKPTLTTVTTSTALKMSSKIASPTAIAEPMLKCLIVVVFLSSLMSCSQIALASRYADDGTDSC